MERETAEAIYRRSIRLARDCGLDVCKSWEEANYFFHNRRLQLALKTERFDREAYAMLKRMNALEAAQRAEDAASADEPGSPPTPPGS